MIIPYNVTLDLKGSNSKIDTIRSTVGDSQSIQLNINAVIGTTPADLTGHTAKITFSKPDKTQVFDDAIIDDAVSGKMHVVINNQAFTVQGTITAEVEVFDGVGGRISSQAFAFAVRQGELDSALVVSTNAFETLTNIITTANNFDNRITTNTNNISSLQTQVTSLSSGSPKGVYSTLSALQTAFPTGNSNIYIVTADGKWYYWNGSAWTAGGTYQSTGIADGIVTTSNLDSNTFNSLSPIIRKLNYNRDYAKLNYMTKFNDGNAILHDSYGSVDLTSFVANVDLDFLKISKYFRASLGANSTEILNPPLALYYANGDFPATTGAWFRKSDLLALNDRNVLIRLSRSTDGTTYLSPDITIATLTPAQATTVGYTVTQTSGGTSGTVTVLNEFNGWTYIQMKITTVDATWIKYKPVFGFTLGTGATQVDIANWTAIKTSQDLIPYFVYPESTNDVELNTKDLLYKLNVTDKSTYNIETQKGNLLSGFNEGTGSVYNDRTGALYTNFINNTDGTFIGVNKYLSIPIVTNDYIKVTSASIPYTSGDTPIVVGAWFRKSDLQNLSDRTFKSSIKYTTTSAPSTYTELFFTEIPITNLLNVGYTTTQTASGISVKLNVVAEYNGWMYIQRRVVNCGSDWAKYKPMFGIMTGTSIGKIDFLNSVIVKTTADLLPFAIYNEGITETKYSPSYLSIRVSKSDYYANEYGMFGDDNFDNGAIFNNLIQKVHDNGGGTIIMPKGAFRYTAEPKWKSGVSLVGAGVGKTILRPVSNGGNGIACIGFNENGTDTTYDNPMTNCNFRDFEMDGSLVVPSSYTWYPKGVYIQFLRNCVFRDLYIHDTKATGLGTDYLDKTVIDNIVTYNCGNMWSVGGPGGAGIGIGSGGLEEEQFDIINCKTYNSGNYGIFIEDHGWNRTPGFPHTKGSSIINCKAMYGRNTGINIQGDNIKLSHCIANGNANHGISLLEQYSGGANGSSSMYSVEVVHNTTNGNAVNGINIPGRASEIKSLKVSYNTANGNTGDGIALEVYASSTIYPKRIGIEKNECSENGGKGINIFCSDATGTISNLKLNGNITDKNAAEGMMLNASVDGLQANDNVSTNNSNGIRLGAVNLKHVNMFNNQAYDTQTTKTQAYGIVQDSAGTIDVGRIEGNDCRDNLTGSVQLNGTNTSTTATNN